VLKEVYLLTVALNQVHAIALEKVLKAVALKKVHVVALKQVHLSVEVVLRLDAVHQVDLVESVGLESWILLCEASALAHSQMAVPVVAHSCRRSGSG
jgi:hypothetical protein